jgi:hypothetical protein
MGTGNREQGTGNREQGTGNREQGTGNREQGTGNREQIRNTHLHQFKAQSKKNVFTRCVARKKQCHYFNLMFLNMSFSCSGVPIPCSL